MATLLGMAFSPFHSVYGLLFSVTLGFAAPLAAQEAKPEKQEKPKITIEKAQELLRAIKGGIGGGAAALENLEIALSSSEMFDEEFLGRFRKAFDVEKLDRDFAKLYVDEFTPEATEACLKFFKGEQGLRWAKMNRELTPVLAKLGSEKGMELGMKIATGQPIPPRKPRQKPEEGSLAEKLDKVLEVTRQREIAQAQMARSFESMKEQGLPEAMIKQFKEHMNSDFMLDLMRETMLERVDEKMLDAAITFHGSKAGKDFLDRTMRIDAKAADIAEKASEAAMMKAMRGGE